MSSPVNRFKAIKAIGMPYHGLATNGLLPTTDGTGDKSINQTGVDWYGGAIYVAGPTAPGAVRNTEQLAHDAANGYEWRDYALLTGENKAINGAGDGLGNYQWIYADAGGASWLVRYEGIKAGANITFNVYLQELFGRFGRQRAFSAQLIQSLVWSPTIPSWYTAGTYGQSDVVTGIDLDWVNTLAFNADGSECYINIFSRNLSINQDVYPETTPSGINSGWNVSTALVGVVKVAISGSGDLDNNGNGITATVTADMDYEPDIVSARLYDPGTAGYTSMPCGFINVSSVIAGCIPYPGLASSGCADEVLIDVTRTFTGSLQNDGVTGKGPVDSVPGATVQYTATLYRTPDGDVVREFDLYNGRQNWTVSTSGGFTETFHLTNCSTTGGTFNPVCPEPWGYTGMTPSGAPIDGTYTTWTKDGFSITVTVCGSVVISDAHETVVQTDGCWECANTQSIPGGVYLTSTCAGPPYSTDTTTSTINGTLTSPGTNIYQQHEVRVLSQNMHYLCTYTSQVNNEATHNMNEYFIGIDYTGSASNVHTDMQSSTYRPPSSAFPDIDNDRHLVFSYQPRTGDFINTHITLFVLYSGDTYQYC